MAGAGKKWLTGCGIGTWQRAQDWHDSETLFAAAVEAQPAVLHRLAVDVPGEDRPGKAVALFVDLGQDVPPHPLTAHNAVWGGHEQIDGGDRRMGRQERLLALAELLAVLAILRHMVPALLESPTSSEFLAGMGFGLCLGLLLGALVIVSAWVLIWIYVRWANSHYDAVVTSLRGGGGSGPEGEGR
mgnify:CR=1 FL=1